MLRLLEPYARSLLRLIIGFTFSLHGFQKVFGMFGGAGGTGARAKLFTLPWVAGGIELVGGVLVLMGLFTIPAALILSGEMAVGYFMMHASRSFWPIRNGGELAVVYCFLFFYLFFAGPGPVSADAIFRKKKAR